MTPTLIIFYCYFITAILWMLLLIQYSWYMTPPQWDCVPQVKRHGFKPSERWGSWPAVTVPAPCSSFYLVSWLSRSPLNASHLPSSLFQPLHFSFWFSLWLMSNFHYKICEKLEVFIMGSFPSKPTENQLYFLHSHTLWCWMGRESQKFQQILSLKSLFLCS